MTETVTGFLHLFVPHKVNSEFKKERKYVYVYIYIKCKTQDSNT